MIVSHGSGFCPLLFRPPPPLITDKKSSIFFLPKNQLPLDNKFYTIVHRLIRLPQLHYLWPYYHFLCTVHRYKGVINGLKNWTFFIQTSNAVCALLLGYILYYICFYIFSRFSNFYFWFLSRFMCFSFEMFYCKDFYFLGGFWDFMIYFSFLLTWNLSPWNWHFISIRI